MVEGSWLLGPGQSQTAQCLCALYALMVCTSSWSKAVTLGAPISSASNAQLLEGSCSHWWMSVLLRQREEQDEAVCAAFM